MSNNTTANVILGLDVNEFRRGITQVDSSIKKMSGQFSALGGVIGAAFVGSKIQEFAQQSIDLALQAEGVARAFERIGNEANLRLMREQVKGTVNDLNLMQQAVKAENLGIPIQNFTKYLGFAKKQAQEMGTSVDYMVESIVNGVGRQSSLILDNLGISASELNMELQKGGTYADAVGRIIDRSMKEAGEQVMTTKDRIDAQRASIENLQMAIGEQLLPIYEAMLGFVADGFRAINHLMGNHLTLWEKIAYLASYANITTGAATRVTLDALAAQRQAMEDITLEAPKMGEGLKIAADKATDGLKKTNKEAEKFVDYLSSMLSLARQYQKEDFEFVAKGEVLEGFEPIDIEEIDMLEGELVPLIEKIEQVKSSMMDAASFGAEFGHILSGAFSAAINDGESFFDAMREGIMEYVKQMAVALATTAALSILFSAITGMPLAASFKAIGQSQGLGNFFGGGNQVNFQGRIQGNDILLGNLRSGTNLGRIGG
jgi:hypothetical protein